MTVAVATRSNKDLSPATSALGLAGVALPRVIATLQAGLPFRRLEAFQRITAMPMDRLAALIGIPPRTLTRRKAGGRLGPDESERLYRIARLVDGAAALFGGDRTMAMQWLEAPARALAGHTPLQFARSEIGAREVEDLIGRLEHGVLS